ncbi:alpha/beta hydrolase [Phycicoccus sp. CMS6Z-2]|nr:alpha/beta hydrolase [Phycicoccus flavus]
MTTPDHREVTLADGRTLEYLASGDEDGLPLVFHHGTPGAAVPFPSAARAAQERGLHLLLVSRAGYGGSSRAPGRSVADVAADTAGLLDHLGRDEFVTLGWSGGGPHSLACAALLPGRCLAASTGAGVGPYGADGLDFLAGMGPENHEEFGLALEGEGALRPFLDRTAATMGQGTVEGLVQALSGLLSDVDRAALTDELAERMLASSRRMAEHGVDGWVDDDLAFTRAWGFDLADVTVPVAVWQGGQDRFVPPSHGQWLAEHVPGARSHVLPGEGHVSLLARIGDVFDDLLDLAGRR